MHFTATEIAQIGKGEITTGNGEAIARDISIDSRTVKQGEVKARVKDVLATVNMLHRAAHYPTHLSGGEQQRVAIARALVIRPAIVLADEPTGNLDRAGGRGILDLIRDINERLHVTVLLVTHDPVFAAYAERALRIVDGALQQDMALAGGSRRPPDGDLALPRPLALR